LTSFTGNLFVVDAMLMTKESAQEVTVMPRKSVDDVLSVVLFSSKKSGCIWAGLWCVYAPI